MAAKEYFSLQRQEHRKGCCDFRSGCCACLLFTLIALVIAALVTALVFLIMQVATHKPLVETACGTVEGKYCPHNKAYIFKGIPYATPPVGDLRWKSAVPLSKPAEGDGGAATPGACGWEGALETSTQKDTCVRIDNNGDELTVVGSEDCLYLNVYTPGGIHKHQSNRTYPVVVFIHGETGADKKYQPGGKMAGQMEVVFVTLQYRLGAMGFLTLNETGLEQANHGITDQIEALKWVKENIANFGGSTNDVTLIGQGTGGSCVLTLVASPEAKGLFHRAWVMSGAGAPKTSQLDIAQRTKKFLVGENCADVGCVRNSSAENITKMMEKHWAKEDILNLPFKHRLPEPRIVIDGKVLTDGIATGLAVNIGSDVPLLIGSAAQSADVNPAPGTALKSMALDNFTDYLNTYIGEDATKTALSMYNFSSSKDSEYKLTTIISDIRLRCQHDDLAAAAAKTFASDVYRYVVKSHPSSEVKAFGGNFPAKYAFQGMDLYGFLGKDDVDSKFIEHIQNMGSAFIREGSVPKEPAAWTTYPEGTALISGHVEIASKDYNNELCTYWRNELNAYRSEY